MFRIHEKLYNGQDRKNGLYCPWSNHYRLCGLVARVLGYRSGGPGSIPGTTRKKKVVGLELVPLRLVSTTEELLDRKVAASVYKIENTAVGIRHADHVAPSIRKKLAVTSLTSGGRSVGIVRSRAQTMEFFFSNHGSQSLFDLCMYTVCFHHHLRNIQRRWSFSTCSHCTTISTGMFV
jgi:hypothetical protein